MRVVIAALIILFLAVFAADGSIVTQSSYRYGDGSDAGSDDGNSNVDQNSKNMAMVVRGGDIISQVRRSLPGFHEAAYRAEVHAHGPPPGRE